MNDFREIVTCISLIWGFNGIADIVPELDKKIRGMLEHLRNYIEKLLLRDD